MKSEEMIPENDEHAEKEVNFIDPDTICGFYCFRPKWLQKMATSRMYLVFFSISCLVLSTYYNYFVGMISTLEKRYAFPTKVSGSLMLAEEIVPLILNIVIGYMGGKTHRPRLVSLGILLSALCCFFTAFPYFIYGSAKHHASHNGMQNRTSIEVCDSGSSSASCGINERPPTISVVGLIVLANFLKGFSNVTINTVAIPYLDDNSKKKNVPIYLAISYSLRLLGPLFGYLLSSACLSFYENPFDDPGYGPEDPRWVGAWWIGFLIQGFLLLVVALPIALFPRRLPGYGVPGEAVSQTESDLQIKIATNENFKDFVIGMFSALKRIMKNPIFLLIIFSTTMRIFGHFGHAIMMPKYVENQFRMSASDANLYSGATSIAMIMISTTLGGLVIWKYRPSIKILLIGMFVTEIFLCVGMIILMVPRCQLMEMVNFGKSSEGLILRGQCNENCGCTTSSYTPYCSSDGKSLFFSPCFAGCSQEDMSILLGQVYSNCSCASHEIDTITKGYCADEACWSQALIYICIYLTMVLVGSFLGVVDTVILLRSVNPKDKSTALGVFEAAMSLFGYMPLPVAFGALVDSSCLVWEKSCDTTGNCWFYDMDLYNYSLHGVSSIFTFFCMVSMIGIYFYRGRIRNLYDEEDRGKDTVDLKHTGSETRL